MAKRNRRRGIVTLADLAPRHDVKGGTGRRVFGAAAPKAREAPAGTRAGNKPRKNR